MLRLSKNVKILKVMSFCLKFWYYMPHIYEQIKCKSVTVYIKNKAVWGA